MTWVVQESYKLNFFERFCIDVMKQGPIPRHVSFIMDGNRRFADKSNINKSEGHKQGFNKLSETLQWCLELGIQEVTVYAFSIENFKRPQEEVDYLMLLAREKFKQLLEERDKLHEKGICIRVMGNLELLPKDIQKTIAEAMLLTKDNNNAILNIAFAYTSRDEILNSINTVIEGIQNHEIDPSNVSEELLEKCLYTSKHSDPDLLVRTSGETRLSDFLLWQSSSTVLYFTKALWPEFTIWHLLAGIFHYQRCFISMHKFKSHLKNRKILDTTDQAVEKFLEKVEMRKHDKLIKMSCY